MRTIYIFGNALPMHFHIHPFNFYYLGIEHFKFCLLGDYLRQMK